MTNNEIDRRLALAIGYTADRVRYWPNDSADAYVQVQNTRIRGDGPAQYNGWQRFDHTDPAVIWPIAERFDCFARRSSSLDSDWWTVLKDGVYTDKDCAAKASALAVIKYAESMK